MHFEFDSLNHIQSEGKARKKIRSSLDLSLLHCETLCPQELLRQSYHYDSHFGIPDPAHSMHN